MHACMVVPTLHISEHTLFSWMERPIASLKTVRLQADATWRDTEIGGLFEVSLGFHVKLPQLLGSMLGGTTEREQQE